MKIAIAGGSGVIGRHLVHALLREDHEVVILSRNPNRVRAAVPDRARVVRWDPTGHDLDWAAELANTAALVNLCAGPPLDAIDSLVDAMASLPTLDRPRAFVSASSIDIYGNSSNEPVTEETAVGGSARARLWLEREAAALAAEQLAVRVVPLRIALVIAHGAPALDRLSVPFRLFVGGPIVSREQWVSWIGIDDVVGLIVRAIGSWDICGPLNLAAPNPVRQGEFAAVVGRVIGRPSWLRVPGRVMRMALGDQAALLLGERRVWPAKALRASYEFVQPDLETALTCAFGRRGRPCPS